MTGYWREYNINHPDCFHAYHLTDSLILIDPVVLDGWYKKDFEGKRFYIPYGDSNEWILDYKIQNDTVFISDKHKWIRYDYNDSLFIGDISGPLMLKVVPELTKKEDVYLDYNQINSAFLHIGELKDSHKEIIFGDTLNNCGRFCIQFNDVIGKIEDIPEFIIHSSKLILNMDKNVSQTFIDSLGFEIRKYNGRIDVYRTYIDLENRRLMIKEIEI
ncbi:hypothetical protein [Marinifilum caeruleilacunae]|uniref:WG repeat-containing protein n=1 Tax=Marinifilum caeruleilacunae TaxID=2499076 RepID=A0ABX1WUN7_9BACT|nr:hypothetical protein [Marinifilum caeruleilacunae]NOU59633.1 hypothetical protein [Marinifilum caeruleilacunae]